MENESIEGSMEMVPALIRHSSHLQEPAFGDLYQTSLMAALMDGVYEGETTFSELSQHGDFGLGTFNDLDGEMVGFDGQFYQLRSDGSARPVSPEQKTPFAVVTFFRAGDEIAIVSSIAKTELEELIESRTQENLFTAIRIDGLFSTVKTRTVGKQQKPFPPLTQAAAHQQVSTFHDMRGSLAGFRSPAYAQGVGVAGFHLHFLRDDHKAGGHALDYVLKEGKIQLAPQHGFHVELPNTDQFNKADLSNPTIAADISEAEG